nr:NADH dehydrogenase subunit 4 [Chiropterargas confusus]
MTVMLLMLCMFYKISLVEIIVVLLMMVMMIFISMEWSSSITYVSEFWYYDMFSFLLVLLSMWLVMLMCLTLIYAKYDKVVLFYILLMLFLLVLCFSIVNIMGFYLLFESVLFPIIMIILGWGNQYERLQAGLYMLFYTVFGSFPLLLFIMVIEPYHSFTYMNWVEFNVGMVLFIMGTIGFLVKLPMFMLHLWLPKAHVEAPLVGSMVLAGVLLKLGVYGLYRMSMLLLIEMKIFGVWLLSLSLLGGVMTSFMCMCQVDIKSLIAYSSVCHMSILLGGLLSMNQWGEVGSCLMMLGHGLCSSGMFCLANMFYERLYTRSILLLSGLGIYLPVLSVWWFLFIAINMSAPFSMNMTGEIFLSGSLMKWSILVIMPLVMISFMCSAYSIYLYSYMCHGKGWAAYGMKMISLQELMLMFLHFVPLIIYILKFELFVSI